MNILFGLFVIAGSLFAGIRLSAVIVDDRLGRWLAGATLFVACFMTAFFVQGFVGLVVHRPIVRLSWTAAATAAIVIASVVLSRRLPVRASTPAPLMPLRRLPRALAVVMLLVFALLAALLLLGLPRGYEVRAYHLPIAIRILRDGTLGLWDTVFMHAYPANMSVWASMPMVLLPERWVTVVDLPFLGLLCAAVFGLGRVAGGDRSAALLVATGLATIPIIGFSALEIGADVAGVAFLAIAAFMLLSRDASSAASASASASASDSASDSESDSASDSAFHSIRAGLAGIAAGLAFGFKSLHLIPIAMLGAILIVECAATRRRPHRPDLPTSAVAAFTPVGWYVAGALAMMSFWLCRNYVLLGNPLYPIHVAGLFDLFSWKAAPDFDLKGRGEYQFEWVRSTREWLVYPWVEYHVIDQNFKHSSGLGAFFAATVPIVVVLWPLHALAAWRERSPGSAARRSLVAGGALYGVALVIVLAWYFLGDRQPRYFMGAIVLLVPLAADLLTQTVGRLRTAYESLLAIAALSMALVLLLKLGVENGPFLTTQAHALRAQALQYPSAVDALPPGAVIANAVDRPTDYALLGEGLRNHVIDAEVVRPRFIGPDHALHLTREGVETLAITHLYAPSDLSIESGPCVRTKELQRFDRNPFNGQPVAPAGVLYAVQIDCVGGSGP